MSCNHNHSSQTVTPYPELNFGAGTKWVRNLTRDRLNNFEGGHFSDVNISSVLYTHRADGPENVKLQVWSAPGRTKPTFAEAIKQEFRPAKKWDSFGPSFEFDPSCEAMIYNTDGVPLQGITGGWGGDRRVEYIIPPEARARGTLDLIIESSCNGMFGVGNGDTINPPDNNRYFSLNYADLIVPNMDAWNLLWDFRTLRELTDHLPGNSAINNRALKAANDIMNVFRRGDPADLRRGRKIAEAVFGEGWEAKGAAVYDEGSKDNRIFGIGHCHIDTAWLWPYTVTQQKVARSWSTQVDLMERYAEHRFAASSAQQWKWLEEQYPPLFARIKAKVLEGKFEPIGGSWVENDSNMPSGEALVRQFLFGQNYFQSRFGFRNQTAWLPDSFGLTGAYPQIIRGAGMKYFFTQKLSWNNINTFPHSTFNWVGIDGTQVLAHLTPVDTYTAQANLGDVNKGITNHKNLESSNQSLLVFGNGDGGGGPLPAMLENLRRIRAASNQHREIPTVTMGQTVDQFFDRLNDASEGGKALPNWSGEMYLEFHRGTYTSHGSIKKGNRHGEILLRDVEHVATLASIYKQGEYVYPKGKIDVSWEKILLNQFHDVLPGSAIGMVYEDAEKLYAEVQADGRSILDEAFKVLFPESVRLERSSNLKGVSNLDQIAAFNTTFFPRQEVIEVPLATAGSSFKSQVVQSSKDGKVGYILADCQTGSSLASIKPLKASSDSSLSGVPLPVTVYTNVIDHFVLRNASVQLTISNGRISSLYDVRLGRELITDGATGGLVIFEDHPNYWDAWDVEIHHLNVATPLYFSNVSVVAHGPLRASVTAQIKYDKSTINVTISLDAVPATVNDNSRGMFRFDADVDWHQRHEFLKFELPLNIRNTVATYECQFGFVQRPTHKNTSWDIAKFEVCGHKFADLSEFGYGVAFLSESKYGFSCIGNMLRISLLRAATAPDADQDQGKHAFSWAILPHKGSFLESDVPQAGYLFNSPLYVRSLKSPVAALQSPFVVAGASNVILETIKRGESDNFKAKSGTTTVVLRLYEAFGGHATARLQFSSDLGVTAAYVTNLLEDEEEDVELNVNSLEGNLSGEVKLDFRGFEIKTVKLVLGTGKPKQKERESWVNISA